MAVERTLSIIKPDATRRNLTGKIVAVWGLTYKPSTDTLRRSSAVELCQWLSAQGAQVRAHDPAVSRLPDELAAQIELAATATAATAGASALVVATPWPDYRNISASEACGGMTRRLVLDANRFLNASLGQDAAIEYFSVGQGNR